MAAICLGFNVLNSTLVVYVDSAWNSVFINPLDSVHRSD